MLIMIAAPMVTVAEEVTPATSSGTGGESLPPADYVAPDPPVPDAAIINVGIAGGSWWTNNLLNFLNSKPDITAVQIPNVDSGTIAPYDVIIMYGNQWSYNAAAVNDYVNSGGHVIATPWVLNNGHYFDALPVFNTGGSPMFSTPLDVTVDDPTDPILNGVNFNNGDPVGYERNRPALKPGAISPVHWNDAENVPAVAYWNYGAGRCTYLNFHYITSDCDLAIWYGWGQNLIYNAIVGSEAAPLLSPETQTNLGWTGDYVEHPLTIRNNGPTTDTFVMTFGDFQWPVTFWNEAGEETWWIGPIPPGGTMDLTAKVRVPRVNIGDWDQVIVTATGVDNPSVTGSATLITRTSLPTPYFNDFESGNFGEGITDVDFLTDEPNNAGVGDQTSYSGSNSMYTTGGPVSITTNLMHMDDISSGIVSFWLRRGSDAFSEDPDVNDDMVVEYRDFRGFWNEIARFPGDGTPGEQFWPILTLPDDALHPRFQVRFTQPSISGINNDWWHIDNLYIGPPLAPALDVTPDRMAAMTGPGDLHQYGLNVRNNNLYPDTFDTQVAGGSWQQGDPVDYFIDDFSTDTGQWTYYGSGARTNGYCQLTTTNNGQVGQALLNYPIQSDFVAEFDFLAGGGNGADGLAFNFYKEPYTPTGGGFLGAVDSDGITQGYFVEFDNYRNGVEPNGNNVANHISINEGWIYNHLAWTADSRTEDNNWHHAKILSDSNGITVWVDDMVNPLLSWAGTTDRTYGGMSFSGGTGGLNNNHRIDNFVLSFPYSGPVTDFPTEVFSPMFADDFDDGDYNGWTVVDEGLNSAPSNWHVSGGQLRETSNIHSWDSPEWSGSYLYYNNGFGWTDYIYNTRIRPVDNDGIGVMFRYTDNDNYYRFRWMNQYDFDGAPGTQKMVLDVVRDGTWTTLASNSIPYTLGQWYDFEVKVIGDRIVCYIDGDKYFDVFDDSHDSGTIALYTWGHSDNYFDDVTVLGQGPFTVWPGQQANIIAVVMPPAGTPYGSIGINDVMVGPVSVPVIYETSQLTTIIADPDPILTPDADTSFGLPGDTITYTMNIENGASGPDIFSLSLSGNNWPTTITDMGGSPISEIGPIPSGGNMDFLVKVSIPPGASPTDVDISNIVASSLYPGFEDTSILTTTVASPNPILTPDTASGMDDPGNSVWYQMNIQNGAVFTDSFDLVATGGWTGNSMPINEGFEGAFPPAGWTVATYGDPGKVWGRTDSYDKGNLGTGNAAICDSDWWWPDTNSGLRTPSFDLTGVFTATLDFDHYYNDIGSADYAEVRVSTDGGGSWTQIALWTADINTHTTLSLNAFIGNPNVMVEFHYDDQGWDWYWIVDNVVVTTTSTPSPPVIWNQAQTTIINQIGPLAPGASQNFWVEQPIPMGADGTHVDTWVTALSQTDNAYTDVSTLTTYAMPLPLWFDDFEDGDISDWTEVNTGGGDGGVGTQTSNSGAWSLFTRWDPVEMYSPVVPLNTYTEVSVGYWIQRGSDAFSEDPDTNENLIVEYLNNAATWNQLDIFYGAGIPGQQWTVIRNLPADALHAGFQLRFRQTAGSGNPFDWWHIDDVTLYGGAVVDTITSLPGIPSMLDSNDDLISPTTAPVEPSKTPVQPTVMEPPLEEPQLAEVTEPMTTDIAPEAMEPADEGPLQEFAAPLVSDTPVEETAAQPIEQPTIQTVEPSQDGPENNDPQISVMAFFPLLFIFVLVPPAYRRRQNK